MFRIVKIHNHTNVDGKLVYYTCTSEDDIAKLPRFGIRGTQTGCMDKENDPCGYGSEATVSTTSSTKLFHLNALNEWQEYK